jgi:PhnB protein
MRRATHAPSVASRQEVAMAKVKPIPQGSHSITAGLVLKDARRAIEFYKTAFGATVLDSMDWPDGRGVMHAELKIGDSKFYVGEEVPEMGAVSPQALGGSPVSINLYVEDCDAVFKRATAAGARVEQPLTDMFWGDRYGKVVDPFGHKWGIATHKEDVSKPEIERRAREWLSQAARK